MPRKKTNESSFDPILSRGIIAIILFITAAVITLSFFDQAGPLGVMLNKGLLSFLFGSIRFATPVVILVIAWFCIKDVEYDYRATHGIGAVLFFLTLAGLFHLGFNAKDMWAQAVLGNGGGVIGMVAWPLKTYLNGIASGIILVGLLIVSLLLMFNTLIIHLIMINKKIFTGLGSFGKNLFQLINTMFVIKKENIANTTQAETETKNEGLTEDEEEYEEDIDEIKEDTEDEETEKEQRFSTHTLKLGQEENEEEDIEEDENMEEGITNALLEEKKAWHLKPVIKELPPTSLLSEKKGKPTSGDIKSQTEIIKSTFHEFGIDVDMGETKVGPTVTRFTLKPSKGVKLSRIVALSNDLSLALAAHPIRIEAPIPGQSLVGIEVPNQKTAVISFKELLESNEFQNRDHNMMVALGKDVVGKAWFTDLPRMPHLLVAGSTGSGKTVCVNTIIMSLLYQNTAETLRMIMVDPKRIELTLYNGIPHLLTPVITNTNKTINALKWTISEMERRFEVLAQDKSRDISSYNKKHPNDKIPYIVFVVDELADLMATAAGEVEAGIIRLAQMARAVGIHLILATQRPSVDVITGLMKANIPGRIAFSLPSLIDSRTILDAPGAEKLLGRGDMLFLNSELSKPVRIQGAFISEEEMKNVVNHLQKGEEVIYDESITGQQQNNGTANMFGGATDDNDPMFLDAKRSIIEAGKASASFLQRKLKIGYSRAARILDQLEAAGIIGPADGAKPREILVTSDETDDTTHSDMTENMHGKNSLNMTIPEKDMDKNEEDKTYEDDIELENDMTDKE